MFANLFDRIRDAWPTLLKLTEAETFVLKAYLDRYPAPPVYYDLDYDAAQRIGTVGEYTDPDHEEWWIRLRATLEYNQSEQRQATVNAETNEQATGDTGEADVIQRMREAIAEKGKDAKPNALIEHAHINPKVGRVTLRRLETLGEYDGFARPKPRRYK